MSSDFPVMLAKNYDPKKIKDWSNMSIEPKWDGIRVLVKTGEDGINFYSRNGRRLDMLDHLLPELDRLAGRLHRLNKGYNKQALFDGEIVSATGNFEDISGAIHRKNATVTDALYKVFHAMPLECFYDKEDRMPQHYRSDCLIEALGYAKYELIGYQVPVKVNDDEEVQKRYKIHRQRGYEGSMVKNMNAPWQPRRSIDWMKLKAEETIDVKVIDLKEGTGKYKGMLGAFICKHRKKVVRVSGMTDKQRRDFWNSPGLVLRKTIEVEYQHETNHGSLRHPRFKRLRPDKDKK